MKRQNLNTGKIIEIPTTTDEVITSKEDVEYKIEEEIHTKGIDEFMPVKEPEPVQIPEPPTIKEQEPNMKNPGAKSEEQINLERSLEMSIIIREVKKQRTLPQPISETSTNEYKATIDTTQPKHQRPKEKPKPHYPSQEKITKRLTDEINQKAIHRMEPEDSKKRVMMKMVCELDPTDEEMYLHVITNSALLTF
jgi:hypothetical protein